MKKIISLILVLAMVCSLLPTAVFAVETEQGESVVLTKTLIPASNGQPDRLKLEAWVTGSTVSTTTTKPTDIILVLDQSGSMDETVNGQTKLSIMKDAVTSFVDNVAEMNEGRDDDALHRVAVVGFASESGYSDNTEILTATREYTVEFVSYEPVADELDTTKTYYIHWNNEYRQISYRTGWNAGWYTGGWNPQEVNVSRVTVYNRVVITSTASAYGVAYNDLEDTHYAGALINCTDEAIASTGLIGHAIDALDGNGATRADLGLEMAADIFDAQPAGTYGSNGREQVVVFLTDGNPTSWQNFDTGIANNAVAAAADMKNDGAHIFSLYLGNPGNNAVSFMQAVSSNYPNASAYNNLGTQAATTYYSAHSDSAAITDVFTQIVNSINAHTTLTEQSVISDSISPYFTLASGADTHSIKVYTVECTGYSNGEYTWSDTEDVFSTAAVSISGKSVQVTNFNFPYHCVTQSNKSSIPGTTDFGRKLVIYVPIIEDSTADSFGGYLPTNTGAGIYQTGASGEDPVVTAPGRYDNVAISYSLHAAERLNHLGLENSLTLTLSEYINTEANGQTMLKEAITRLPNGSNNAGVDMTYYLIDPGTDASFGGSGPSDDTILATLTVAAGDTVDVTDFDNWTMAPGINAEDTVTLTIPDDGSNMAEKVLILACRLTSTEDVQTPDTALYYSNLDYIITNSEAFVVYGEIDQGGTLEVTDANHDNAVTGTVFGNTYTEAIPYTETTDGIVGGDSDKMTFTTLPGYEIVNIQKLTKDASGADVPATIYSIAGGTGTLTADETLDLDNGTFTAQVTNIQTDTAYEIETRLKQFTLVTEHDKSTHIDPGHTYAYDDQNSLQVWFHATEGNRITSVICTEEGGSIAFYPASDLLSMSASELADLGLTLVTADSYDANGNAVTVITGGTVSLPKTQSNYVAVTGAARYYKLSYNHYIENGTDAQPINPWTIPDDVAANLAAGAFIPADAKHSQVSYVAYGDTLTVPPLKPGSHRQMISDGVQYTFRGAFETYTGTEFTGYVDLVDEQGVISLTMPAHDEDFFGFWEKDPNVELDLGTITKVLNKSHTEDQTFSFAAMFHEKEVGTISVNVPAGSTEAVSDMLTITLTAAQQTRFQAGDKIYIYEIEDEADDLWLYDNTRYELSYGDEGITVAVSGTGAAADKVVFTNRQKAPTLSVEKTLTSDNTAEVGETVTWEIVVTNSGTAAGKFQLADQLNGQNLTYTSKVNAENGWYTIPADSEITFNVSYIVQPEDAGKDLVNVAVMTPEGEDSKEDPADPVVVTGYAVTYTDGVANEDVFADKTVSDLQYGADTPKYDDDNTPVRDGYIFTGWTPTWQDKVTGNAEYTANWVLAVPSLTVEKTLTSGSTAKVGDTVTWEIVVTNSGTAAGKFQLADQLNGENLTYTTIANAENGWYTIPANSALSFDVSYIVQPEDAGKDLVNVAVMTPEGEDPKEDPADPVVVTGYTVTYIDGTDEPVFRDKSFSNLAYGTDTPKYDDDNTPVRAGYIFTGWTPTWQDKVTGNAEYTANWVLAVPSLTVEKTLTSGSTAKVGDTVTWEIVVTNSGTAAGKFQLADQLNGENLTYTTIANAENGWYTIPANSALSFDVSYTVQPEDAGKRLVNVAVLTPEGEDPKEDPADPVVVDTFSVTYTDGVANEEVFGDKMESGLQYGADTPKYDDDNTPVRDGFIFTGWTPTWQDKVTGNAVYTANWTAAVPSLSVEKTLSSGSTAKVGDTVTWEIVVTNSGTAAGKFQLADQLNGENLTYTTIANAENGWYIVPANSALSFDVSYTVQPEDAGKRLVNVAVLTPEGEDPKEDPADPVVVDTFSVTYIDGTDEPVFRDKSFSNLAYGTDTPKYDDDNTPVRGGYIFTGWTPTWQDKVTGNAVYTANWRANNYGIAVDKTLLSSNKAKPGDTVMWKIEVTNTGNTNLQNIHLADRLTGAAGSVILLDAFGKELTDSFTFDLAVGATRTFTAKYDVRFTDIGKTLKNIIVVSNENTSDEDESEEVKVGISYLPLGVPALNKQDHFAYIVGYEDGTVRPNSKITRAETATIFFRLLTDEDRAFYWSKTNPYNDVSSTDWFNNAISTLTNANILEGMTATTFLPNEPITRAQFATMAARFSDVVYTSGSTFTDVPDHHWAARYIALAQHLGYVDGYPDGTFRPDQHITRAEAMTLINRVLERAVEKGYMLPHMIQWPDNPTDAWYYEAVQEATNSHYYKRTRFLVPNQSFYYEYWTDIIPAPDWEALERSWSDFSDVKRG